MESRASGRRISGARVTLLGIALAMLWCAGCASPLKRYEQGLELEGEGRYASAADKYIDALRRDPELAEARLRLTDVAPRLADEYLERSAQFGAANNFVGGAETLRSLDGFVGSASGVGVPVPLPPDYPATRHRMFDDAIAQLMDEGAALEAQGAWNGAMQRYERVQSFSPDAAQRSAALGAGFEAATDWSRHDLAAGRCRAAFEHAELAAGIAAQETQLDASPASELRDEALRRGTLHVAIAPAWRSDAVRATLPSEFLGALDDELEAVYWARPPLFVDVVDPAWVRRELRQSGAIHATIDPRQARRLGRSCRADVVVTADVVEFDVQETNVTEEQHATTSRDGKAVTYGVRRGKRNYRVRVEYRVVDCRTSANRPQKWVATTSVHDFEQAHAPRTDAELVLREDERRPFDADRAERAQREAEQRLVEETAQKLAAQVYRDVLTLVP